MRELSSTDISILGAAREVLREQARHEYDGSPHEVRTAVEAEHAVTAIFDFLKTAHIYMDVPMTYTQLHGWPEPEKAEPCPFYAIQESPGGGYELVHCDQAEGHDDSHRSAEWDGETAWEHPEGSLT